MMNQKAHQKITMIHGKFFHIDMVNLQRLKLVGCQGSVLERKGD